tara:strand:- start:992 stop:1786 length:795 start_codon:yes stop_codon:yes gene_type:complete
MSDADLRQLERRFRETGTVEDESAWLASRVRQGTLSERRLALLAGLGYRPACIAVGAEPLSSTSSHASERDDLAGFRRALAETVVWCSEAVGAGPRGAFRTPGLRGESSDWGADGLCDLWTEAESARIAVVEGLRQRRALLLRESGWVEGASASALPEGRLLIFYPDGTLTDGAAAAASYGFFNDGNVPPWDTWVTAVTGLSNDISFDFGLVCWIPPRLVPHAEDGIEVNPEECIRWLDDVVGPFPRKLAAAGLLSARQSGGRP